MDENWLVHEDEGDVGYTTVWRMRHDTIPPRSCRMHRVCCMVILLSAYADLADDEMFAYTHFEMLESDR